MIAPKNVEAAARLGINSVLFDTVEKTASRVEKPIRHPHPSYGRCRQSSSQYKLNKSAPGSDEIRLMQQGSLQQVRVSVSLIFLIHGLIIATWASRIPAFQAQPPSFSRRFGQVVDDGGNRFRSRHACR